MCGLVGYLTTEEKAFASSRYRFLHQALIADTMRGDDSTGAYFVKHDAKAGQSPMFCKSTAPGYDFVTYDPDWHALSGTGEENYAAIGHNRSATVGKVMADTAHPFQRGPITLVHNGTLRNTYGLPVTEQQGGFFNDSDSICGNLIDTPITELSEKLGGAYALIWHDSRDNTMNIVRNDQRPLFLATVKGQNSIFIASESMMMQWILSRLKVDIETIAYPKPYQWLRFQHGSLKPEVVEVPRFTSSYNTHGYGGYGGYANDPWEYMYDDDGQYTEKQKQEIYYPKGQGPRGPAADKGASTSYSNENRITIGGRKQPVPVLAQELLLEVDMLVEDREAFEPLVSQAGTKSNVRAVSGYLPETGISAMLYGVPEAIINSSFQRQWVVQPITVKMNDDNEPVVICKLRHTDADGPKGQALLRASETYSGSYPSNDPEESTISDEALTLDTDGMNMSRAEYISRTEGGCINCSGAIMITDADDILWVNEGRDPVCPVCVAEVREEIRNEQT